MEAELIRIREEALCGLEECRTEEDIEALQVHYLGRKGALTTVLRGLRELPQERRPAVGELANQVSLSQATVTTILDRLEKRKLVYRERQRILESEGEELKKAVFLWIDRYLDKRVKEYISDELAP